jgi:FkbM family methyltransferase
MRPRVELYEWLRNVLMEDPVVKLSDFQGMFALDIRSDLFRRFVIERTYEPELAALCVTQLQSMGDRDAIDVGANVGFFTTLIAKNISIGRKVLAIEPTPNASRRLARNILQNNVNDYVIVFVGAASASSGRTEISIVEGKEEYSSLGSMSHPDICRDRFRKASVEIRTIDALVEQFALRPGFMKVDVEGFEHMVFRGAQKVLEKHRPIIISELSDFMLRRNGSSAEEVINIIKSAGYRVVNPFLPHLPAEISAFGDILCLPVGEQ